MPESLNGALSMGVQHNANLSHLMAWLSLGFTFCILQMGASFFFKKRTRFSFG